MSAHEPAGGDLHRARTRDLVALFTRREPF